MALPAQEHHQQQHQCRQDHQQSLPFRNLHSKYGGITAKDQPPHLPYEPPAHASGYEPGPVRGGRNHGAAAEFRFGVEEREFFNNNSQMPSVDSLQGYPVSTGFGSSLDNTHNPMASSGDSALLSLLGDHIDKELQRQEKEIDRLLKVQANQMRKTIIEKAHQVQPQITALMEESFLQEIHEKESEIGSINTRNKDLQEKIKRLTFESGKIQQQVLKCENTIAALKFNLQQVYAQNRERPEGCGESGVDGAAFCCDGNGFHHQPLEETGTGVKRSTEVKCKACWVHKVRVLLFPCRHLCLCEHCARRVMFCPLSLAKVYRFGRLYALRYTFGVHRIKWSILDLSGLGIVSYVLSFAIALLVLCRETWEVSDDELHRDITGPF